MALFVVFAVITQLQFKKISDDKLYDTKLSAYQSDVEAYDAATKSVEECLDRITARETYRKLFTNTATLIESAGGPSIADEVQDMIRTPLLRQLPVLLKSDCPVVPTQKPVKPTR